MLRCSAARLGFKCPIRSAATTRLALPPRLFTAKFTTSRMTLSESEYRLPTHVKPQHYDLTIKTDLEKLEFQGLVKISLDVIKETSTIVLNSEDLELGEAFLLSPDAAQIQLSHVFDVPKKRVSFALPSSLPAGSKAELKIPFAGKLGDGMTGYYRSAWSPDGHTKYYALTQFEATDARTAFPCFDEPALKASYKITMVSRSDTVNLSNMPATSEVTYDPLSKDTDINKIFPSLVEEEDSWKITRFETTPHMSTYILAWACGPFKSLESSVVMPSGKTIPLRIYTTPDLLHQAQFALDVKAKVLPLYEKMFDVEYPLPKLDTLVATDFDAGAMENWGLITGRTSAFLLDPKNPDLKAKKQVIFTQSHEVAHMWFGNITTMQWWDNLYLNEGFATLMGEVIIPSNVYPELRPKSEFINAHLSAALALDAKLSSHAIEVPIEDAETIDQIFDSLSYSKAASVLRMLASHVGEERFLKGVSLYLKDHLFANSVTADLWAGVQKATGMDIARLMDNWITKIGFPVVTVTESSNGIHLRQDRFLETGLPDPADNTTIWNIPLAIMSVDEDGTAVVDKSLVLEQREQTIPLDTSKTFKLNAGTTGVYRVLYTPERLTKIATEAAKENSYISLDDRLGLVTDSLALSKAGLAKLSSALDLIDILRNEKEYLVWSSIAGNLSILSSVWWEDSAITANLDAFKRSLFLPLVERLGYENLPGDSPDTTQLRSLAIASAADAGDEKVVAELKRRFSHYMETGDETQIPADIRRAIYTTVAKSGGVSEYEALLKIHQAPSAPTAGTSARAALAMVSDPKLLERTFETIKTGCRDQDVFYFLGGFTSNTTFRREIVAFFKREYAELSRRFEKNSSMRYAVQLIFTPLTAQKDYVDTEAFFKDKDTSKYHMALAQALDSIRARSAFIEHSSKDLSTWLADWARKCKM
ncbi:leucyl aminopeptidase [Mycena floridula]|nr:leucyl aminopeptidase [Mycena floridula]